jgi:hypothetical protein
MNEKSKFRHSLLDIRPRRQNNPLKDTNTKMGSKHVSPQFVIILVANGDRRHLSYFWWLWANNNFIARTACLSTLAS